MSAQHPFDPTKPFSTQHDFNRIVESFSRSQAESERAKGEGGSRLSKPHLDNDTDDVIKEVVSQEAGILHTRHRAILEGWEYRSRALHPLIPDRKIAWLVKRCKRIVQISDLGGDGITAEQFDEAELEGSGGLEEDRDDGVSGPNDGNAEMTVVDIEFHVVYHQTYRIPQLLFGATYSDGMALTLNDLITAQIVQPPPQAISSPAMQDHLLLPHSISFPLLEKLEHPAVKGMTVWGIHPCEVGAHVGEVVQGRMTEGVMNAGEGAEEGALKWLESWFMIHSTLVDMS